VSEKPGRPSKEADRSHVNIFGALTPKNLLMPE